MMEIIAGASVSQPGMSSCPWPFLPTDLLLDVSGRLHDARDFVRFHAVCQPWREAGSSLLSPAAKHMFLPWVISSPPNRNLTQTPVFYLGSISFDPTLSDRARYYGNALRARYFHKQAWVASADGEAVWHFNLGLEPKLVDLVTKAETPLPPFPDDNNGIKSGIIHPRGVVYADRTVLLYGIADKVFTAAILPAGETAWRIVEKRLGFWPFPENCCAAYHNNKVLVLIGRSTHFWCILTRSFEADGGDDMTVCKIEMTQSRMEKERYIRLQDYAFESRGELLWASILIEHEWIHANKEAIRNDDSMVHPVVVIIRALKEDVDGDISKMRWVKRDARTLGDRVLFLGLPASFAMDATQLGVDGGCAYFLRYNRVFRYNIFDGKTSHVQVPCLGLIDLTTHVWLQPQPAIAPIQEIRERIQLRKNKQKGQKSNLLI